MGVKRNARAVLPTPPGRTTKGYFMATTKDTAPAPPTRERGTCAECGTTTKTLTAPRPNVGHGYTGPMYCLPCNPRFGGVMLDAQWSALERLEA